MLALNINSLVTLTYLLLPAMLEKKQGLIINVASTAAFQPLPYIAIYGASKTFVLNFTEAIAGENLYSGVRFLALCPRNTATNFAQVANADTDGMPVSTVETVVDAAIWALGRNQLYYILGKRNYFSTQFARIIPRFIMLKIVENMFRKKVVK
jgi:short-subunit dehydrogenase